MKKTVLYLLLAVSLLLNGFLLYEIFQVSHAQFSAQAKYPLLSKRIFAAIQNDLIINFIPLRTALKEYAEKQQGKVGVYFEYLPSGTSIGVNDKEEVRIASLYKVPIVMSILKKVQRGLLSLDDVIVVKEENLDKKFGTLWERGAGTQLTVSELMHLSLTKSDNTAHEVLFDQLTASEINEVYAGLDIPVGHRISDGETYALISPKNYSSIFRSLYLSSFLPEKHSNFILQKLTETDFHDKIPAGVPEGIPVAHKIGVYGPTSESSEIFIDCGIVYAPQRPYVLCIFVQDDELEARKHMSYISQMIYGYMIRVKGQE